ncbi:MAG TPA: CoA transferase, partial [Dehalococcoidia bacterium]|nr:CoA transferase [Dehalococcoidia bacterium]
ANEPLGIGDTGAGLQLALIALAGLERRRQTGQGVVIDMSQLEAAATFVGPALLDAAVNGTRFVASGNLLPDREAAPHGAYPTAGEDRWIAIAVLEEAQWRVLAREMGRPTLATDPRFATAADRIANVEALDALVAGWTRDQVAEELAARLQAIGVPAGPIQESNELYGRDPQLAARGFFQPVEQPEIGTVPMDTMPLRWSDGPVPIRLPAPRLGEHTEAVLREVLGLSEEELVELILSEVV